VLYTISFQAPGSISEWLDVFGESLPWLVHLVCSYQEPQLGRVHFLVAPPLQSHSSTKVPSVGDVHAFSVVL